MKKVLLGINGIEEESAQKILMPLKANEVDVDEYVMCFRKTSVEQNFMQDGEIKYAIVQERLESTTPYAERGVDRLTDLRGDVTVLPVLEIDKKGEPYVKVLYNAAIYNALFDKDASVSRNNRIIDPLFRIDIQKF